MVYHLHGSGLCGLDNFWGRRGKKNMIKKAVLNCSKFKMSKSSRNLSHCPEPTALYSHLLPLFLWQPTSIWWTTLWFPLTNMDTILLNPGWDFHCHVLSLVQQHYYKARDIFEYYEASLVRSEEWTTIVQLRFAFVLDKLWFQFFYNFEII